jgi:hypothetical protein
MNAWGLIAVVAWVLLALALMRLQNPRSGMTRYEAIQRLRDAEAARRDHNDGRS